MPVRKSSAVWLGTLKEGNGTIRLGSGAFEGPYSFASRFQEDTGTNPEELIAGAHAGCFSQAFSLELQTAGYPPERIATEARVKLEKVADGFRITEVLLATEAVVPGIDEETFQRKAEGAGRNCPVSKALAGVKITVNARLAT